MAHTAYKFRLTPTADQTRELLSQLETLRQVFNAGLAYWRELYAAEGRSPKANELYKAVCTLRNLQLADQKAGGAGPHWLTRVAAVAIRDTLKRVKKAYDGFFRRLKAKDAKAGFPRFKSYGRLSSIPFENYASGCVLRGPDGKAVRGDCPAARHGYRLDLFGVGRVKVLAHRPVVGVIKTVSVLREPDGKWYVVLVAQQPDADVPQKVGPAVGVDVGLEHFLTTSDGDHEPNPKYLKANLKALRRLQRAAARKVLVAKKAKRKFRECKNLQRSFTQTARLHVRIRNLRKEHHHQVANRLVRRYATVCVENLNVHGMLRLGKLSRAISDAGWAGFLNVLRLKAAKAGVRYVEVDARGTSQACPECGAEVCKGLKDRTHLCPHCGYAAQRDYAAARVILARGVEPNGAGPAPAGHNLGVTPGVPRSFTSPRTPLPPDDRPREVPTPPPRARPVKPPRSRGSPQVPRHLADTR